MAVQVQAEPGGNLPPQDLQAEGALLGAIFFAPQALAAIGIEIRLKADDFYSGRNRLIFAAMRRLEDKAEPEAIDSVTVTRELQLAGELEAAGGAGYVQSLGAAAPSAGHFKSYAKIVKDLSKRRRLLLAAREIQDSVFGFAGETSELLDQSESTLFKIGQEDNTGDLRSIGDVLDVELDKLERVSREGIAISGTPSGFKGLDEITGGFQKGNLIVLAARPAMGKCLRGSSRVYDPTTGARRPIADVVAAHERGERVTIAALTPRLNLEPVTVTNSFRNGVKPLFRVKTRLGRRIDATANHPLLTIGGWRAIEELRPGERIGVPRRLPGPVAAKEMPDHDLVLLAALIADGNLTQKTPRFCFGDGSPVIGEVEKAVAEFGCRLRGGEKGHGTATISRGRGSASNPVTELCRRHGLWGLGSAHKFVPTEVFSLSDAQIARFLSVLYGCDGHVHSSERLRQIGYTTISERLAHDVQHLLLRLGIVSKIRTLRRPVYDGTGKVAREVLITGCEDLEAFCTHVPVVGKEARVDAVLNALAATKSHTNVDTVPAGVWERIDEVRGDRPWRALSAAAGRPPNHNWHVGARGVPRGLLSEIAAWSGDAGLRDLSYSDLWWDEVVSIDAIGEEETFDLTVPGAHNFVADDVIVHNSALVVNIAANASMKHGRPVALFSLEMSEAELAQRFIAVEAKENGDNLRKGKVAKDRWPRIVKATEKLAGAPLYVDDSSDLGIHDLRAKARRLHSREGLGLVVVDYLQLMRPEDSRISRVEQIGQISRGLKILARELRIPVIAVSQLSRAVESRNPPVPMLSDLRESGQIEQDADLVAFIYRHHYYNKEDVASEGKADLIISKHRNGPVGEVKLAFMAKYPRFADLLDDPMSPATPVGAEF